MKDFYIADAARFENQAVTSLFLLAQIGVRDRKGNGQYLALTLADKTGQFEARMWEEFADIVTTCASGCYVKVQGTISKYQGKFQITITKMRLAAASEIDTADFIPTTQFDIAEMLAELRGYVADFKSEPLRVLVLSFLDDPALGAAFAEAPAAKRLHHAWIGGLLEHVLCLVRVCRATVSFYPEVDPDLLLTGAILQFRLHAGGPVDRPHLDCAGDADRAHCPAGYGGGQGRAAGGTVSAEAEVAGGAYDPVAPRQIGVRLAEAADDAGGDAAKRAR
jgi:3'-5' exoribonuclease